MFRKNGKPLNKTIVNVTLCDGGLGDILCYLISVNYMLKNLDHVVPNIWVPDYLFDFAKNVLPDCRLGNFTQAEKYYNPKLTGLTTAWKTQHTPMRIHPTDYANHVLLDTDLPIEEKNYLRFNSDGIDLTRFNLPEQYAVISVGATSKAKELPVYELNKISEYVVDKGYVPVFLGKSTTEAGVGSKLEAKLAKINYALGLDLTNKTSLVESAAIISKAKVFIGMEGGLTHLAGFTEVKIVAGYSFVDPKRMMPIRNNVQGYNVFPVEPEPALGCRYCQTNMALLYNHDFRNCLYDDYLCIKQLTFNKWKEQIDKCLEQ